MIRIVIVDDHSVVRKGIVQIITECADIVVAGEASNGYEAIAVVEKTKCDVVLLDVSMPGKNGLEVLKELKQNDPNAQVLMLSMSPEEQYAMRALRSGAAGYLTKGSAPDELVAAIRKVSKGGKYVTASLAEKLATSFGLDAQKQRHELLSDREFQVMSLIASGETISEIAAELNLSVKTISTYRTRILEKMGMNNNAEVTHYAIKNDLVN